MLFSFYNNTGHDIFLANSNTNNVDDLHTAESRKYGASCDMHTFKSDSKFVIIKTNIEGRHIAASLPMNQKNPKHIVASITVSKGDGFIPIPNGSDINMLIEMGTYYTTNDRWIDPLYQDRFYTYGIGGLYEIEDIYKYMDSSNIFDQVDVLIIVVLVFLLLSIVVICITIIIHGVETKGIDAFKI
jgi:hypothetical protein